MNPGYQHGVATAFRRFYLARLRTSWMLPLPAILLAACAPGAATVPAGPVVTVDSTLVDSARALTAPARPLQVTFDWSMQDRDARFSGQGVVRIAPGYRARLDLFGPRGEAYLVAVMEEERVQIVPAAASSLLPPPAFLWASIGVFRRPSEPLTVARRDGTAIELAFAGAQERWQFRIEDGRFRRVEWHGADGGRRTVELTGAAALGLPSRGTYRDWREFRELSLSVTRVEEVDAFPADIWQVVGGR